MIVVFDVTEKQGEICAKHEATVFKIQWNEGKHAEILGKHLYQLREKAPITQLGVITGPGSFTGIRIGISMALGINSGSCSKIGGTTWGTTGGTTGGATGISLYAQSKFDLAWTIPGMVSQVSSNECIPRTMTQGIFFSATQGNVYAQRVPNGPIEVLPYSELNGTWHGTFPSLRPDHQALPSLTNLFLELIEAQMLTPTQNPAPLYVRPPDAKATAPLLERLLNK